MGDITQNANPKGPQYKAQQFLDAIPNSGGIITLIAKRVGCTWHTAAKYIKEYATISAAYADECEGVLDLAEAKLIEAIKAGDLAAVKYILSTKGKKRGYTERTEVSGIDGDAVKIRVVFEETEQWRGGSNDNSNAKRDGDPVSDPQTP